MDLLTLLMAVKLAPKPLKSDVIEGVADWLDDHPEATTTVEDGSITEAKLASALKAKINNTSGLTDDIKQALLECFAHVAWTDAHGQEYLDALDDALYPSGPTPAELASISAVYTQSGTVYDTASLDDLKTDLVVTAHYDNGTSEVVTTYTLSGTLTEGTSTITVSYGGKTDTFDVTVTHVVSEEVISTFTANSNFDNTTFEQTSDTNTWTAVSTINASKITFAWDTTLHDIFSVRFCQLDENGTPYKLSGYNVYPSNPVTDGSAFDTHWNNPGGAGYFTAVGSGNITINLPTSGIVKMAFRKGGSGGSEVTSNATFGEWLNNGRLTITAHI